MRQNSIFSIRFLPPTLSLAPCWDLDGIFWLTLVFRVHISAPYIHTYENMTYGFILRVWIFWLACQISKDAFKIQFGPRKERNFAINISSICVYMLWINHFEFILSFFILLFCRPIKEFVVCNNNNCCFTNCLNQWKPGQCFLIWSNLN